MAWQNLRRPISEFNVREMAEFNKTNTDDSKVYKEKKLPEAFICSGERDSLCCRSLGYHPLWFNSETYKLSDEEYREIMKYVEVLYNIPDIDETGIAKGTELALRFIDIHTIWLLSGFAPITTIVAKDARISATGWNSAIPARTSGTS